MGGARGGAAAPRARARSILPGMLRAGRRALPRGEYRLVTGSDPAAWERVWWDEGDLVPIERREA